MTWHFNVATLLLAVSLPLSLSGQSTAARIQGTVADQTGAVVPGAVVTTTNTETGWTAKATSNAEGQYALYPLPPGIYGVTFEKTGFQSVRIDEIQLYANDNAVRNASLAMGAISDTITISAAAPVLNLTPSVENTVTQDQVVTLPLNGRDYNQLVFLGAGAVDFKVTGVNQGVGSMAVNGNQPYSNDYSFDGVPNNSPWQNTSAISLSVDLIREFKVVSGVAPAEYGQGGTNVVVVSKSGTNRFHGSLFEYHRGNTFVARDPFLDGSPADFRRDQFGGSLGGPVLLPKYNGQNRTFFFVNYEGLRQTGGDVRIATVPTDAFWKGDFSALLPRIQLRDPLATGRPVIPGNRLDQYLGGARINATALKIRPVFAAPTSSSLVNNSVHPVNTTITGNQYTIKADHLLPHNQPLSVRLTVAGESGYTPGAMGLPDLGMDQPTRNVNGMVGWTVLLNSRTVNELRLGASTDNIHTEYFNGSYPNADTIGLKGFTSITSTGMPPMPRIQFSGADALTFVTHWSGNTGGQLYTARTLNVFSISEMLSTTLGKHQLKAGASGRASHTNHLYMNNVGGTMTFNGANVARSTGYSFADFLLGLPSTSSQSPLTNKVLLLQPEAAFFVQDDWRLARNFTLTLGLRHETFFSAEEDRNRLAMFSPEVQGGGLVVACSDGKLPSREFLPDVISRMSNAQGEFSIPMACGSSLGYDPRRLVQNALGNIGPRVGLAWDPLGSGKWLIRSGYGIFYSRFPQNNFALTVGLNPPFAGTFNYSEVITNNTPNITLESPYLKTGTANVILYGMDKQFQSPSSQQWNFTVERTLGSNAVLSVKYLGNKGTHLFRSVNLNTQSVDPATGAIVRKYQSTFGTAAVNQELSTANSTYHAMQAEMRRRFAHGLAYQLNWTWAKGIDDVGAAPTASGLDLENLGRDRANSNYVRRHMINGNFTWELPVGRGRAVGRDLPGWLNAGVGGWRLSGIWRFTTGRYLTPSFVNSTGFGSNNRPDVVSGVSADLPRSQRSASRWFNPDAFAVPPATDPVTGLPRFGNAGRNIVVGPGLNTWDANLGKSIRVGGEQRRIVLRMDLFNVLNHPVWANPDMSISSPNTVAVISDTNRPMRQAQFSIEFQF